MDSSKPSPVNDDPKNTEAPEPHNSPKPKPFLLTKGQTLVVNGSAYKVTAARPNGKVTMKFVGVRQ